MHNILSLYFSAIRALEDIVSDIQEDEEATKIFNEWTPEKRMHFIDISTGKKGVKMLYEPFLQEMVRIDPVREAMDGCMSSLTGRDMTIKKLAMEESAEHVLMECIARSNRTGEQHCIRFVEEESLFRDEEMTPGEENAFTVFLLEKTPDEFRLYQKEYIYYGCGSNEKDAVRENPGEYCIFCKDRFDAYIHESGVQTVADAWWAFLVCDAPDIVVQLIIKYPFFVMLYETLYQLLGNTKKAVRLMYDRKPQTDCGKKCTWLIKTERLLEEQRMQIAFQGEQITRMQEMIDKQAYIISEQCRQQV